MKITLRMDGEWIEITAINHAGEVTYEVTNNFDYEADAWDKSTGTTATDGYAVAHRMLQTALETLQSNEWGDNGTEGL